MSQPLDIHTLAGAYTLDALDDLERASFDRHLAGCPACALEVAELRETVARLTGAATEPPPARLRANVLSEVAGTRQVGPGKAGRPVRARPIRWRVWTAGAVAAGVLAAGAAVTTYLVQDRRVRQAERIQTVLTAPDAVTRTAPARGGGQVSMVLSPARDAAVVVLAGLTAPDSAHAYQLWLIDGGGATSAGVLRAGQADGARYLTGVRGADQFGVTLEPAGGSARPSAPSLATLPLR
jgi:anti-sigma factor RsiW